MSVHKQILEWASSTLIHRKKVGLMVLLEIIKFNLLKLATHAWDRLDGVSKSNVRNNAHGCRAQPLPAWAKVVENIMFVTRPRFIFQGIVIHLVVGIFFIQHCTI